MYTILVLLTFSCQYSMSSNGAMNVMAIDRRQAELWSKVDDTLTGNLGTKENDNNIVNTRDAANDSNTIIPGAFGYTWALNSKKKI